MYLVSMVILDFFFILYIHSVILAILTYVLEM